MSKHAKADAPATKPAAHAKSKPQPTEARKKLDDLLKKLATKFVYPDAKLEAAAIKVLKHPPSKLSYQLGSLSVVPKDLQKIAAAIKRGDIRIIRLDAATLIDEKITSGPEQATYFDEANILFTDVDKLDSLYRKSLVFHEATHMIHDMKKLQGVNRLDNEVLAFTTQMMYLRLVGFKGGTVARLTGGRGDRVDRPTKDAYDAAFALAEFAESKARKTAERSAREAALIADLRQKVTRMPVYAGDATKFRNLDGL